MCHSTLAARAPPRHSTPSALVLVLALPPALPTLFLYRYRFEPDLIRLLPSFSCPTNARHPSRRPAPPPRDPFLLRAPLPALADVPHDSARSTRVTRPSSLSCPSRTIFMLVVQACFPSPCPRTRSTCSSPGARTLMRDPPLTARRYHAVACRSISLFPRSVCDPHCTTPMSPAVSMRIPSAPVSPVSPRAPPDPLCRSYLRLAEPASLLFILFWSLRGVLTRWTPPPEA
ncbi:hypothetical protein B0H13DRAFT_2343125 [Mycena leptocephala]|nr:hypothetical protein B0H13DRAFT_2343125 [Mycena leptocephala]